MVQEFILKEGALNDDVLKVAPVGYRFKGGGRFMVVCYTFASSWANNEICFRSRTFDAALKRYQKICGKLSPDEIDNIRCYISE